ncbi:MAG: pilus assembly protein [Silicimonas sp.]|nr:pilus assembly protein [Silicimonas sp.]
MIVLNKARAFRGKEEGNATVEFVVLFPAFIFLFLTGFEAGYYMVRNVMLERAVDVAVRDVRLGGLVPKYDDLKASICNNAGILPDCMDNLMVEMDPVLPEPGNVATVASGPIRCVDKSGFYDQDGSYSIGSQNQAMLIRVCSLSQPIFPTTGIGVGMRVDMEGNYAIVATASFVNEPGNRALNICNAGIGNGGEGCDPGNSGAHNNAGDDAGEVAANSGSNAGGNGNGNGNVNGNGNGNGGNP